MGKIFSSPEELTVDSSAPDLPIIYRQCYYWLSDYLPNTGFILSVFLVDYTMDNFSDEACG